MKELQFVLPIAKRQTIEWRSGCNYVVGSAQRVRTILSVWREGERLKRENGE